MRRRIQTLGEVVRDTVSNWLRHRSAVESAALAFYTMFSLAPMLLVVISVAGAIWGAEAVRGQIVHEFEGLMGREGVQEAFCAARDLGPKDALDALLARLEAHARGRPLGDDVTLVLVERQ